MRCKSSCHEIRGQAVLILASGRLDLQIKETQDKLEKLKGDIIKAQSTAQAAPQAAVQA